MKEKTFYKTPSVKVVRLEVERVCQNGSPAGQGEAGAAGGTGKVIYSDPENDY